MASAAAAAAAVSAVTGPAVWMTSSSPHTSCGEASSKQRVLGLRRLGSCAYRLRQQEGLPLPSLWATEAAAWRRRTLCCTAGGGGDNRRKGRPAHMRDPDDSPLRDGNRDMLMGLLTERAAKTLLYYTSETNQQLYSWMLNYIKDNPIPRTGSWEDISGQAFLDKMLFMLPEHLPHPFGIDEGMVVDPRSIAQRIMEIRVHLAKEFTQDLKMVKEENSEMLRRTIKEMFSLAPAARESAAPADEKPPQ
eukprot:jgi/Chlat1/3629/Chrsp237S03615